ncbi:helix-turn-helix domain-containing protein [Enterococcus sp. AZ163]|uniref:helix-turn-helix domain-containing protein n=1 Tax=Enterococcus sp. AZ163 TaxID=2774638 RepID=UPI003D2B646C
MRPLLLLTKNLLIEQRMQEQLHYLNYEVFCSVELVKQLKTSLNRLQTTQSYQGIIFSETLSDEEIRKLLVFLDNKEIVLFRKFGHLPSVEEKESLSKLGMDSWIYDGQPADFLREHLAETLRRSQKKENKNVVFLYQKESSPQTLSDFKAGLTKKECKAFDCLLGSEGGTISREELCNYLWGSGPSNSRMSQMSVLMKRLKKKLHTAGFQEELIETVWGYGYKLSPKLLQFYAQEVVE